ncbi:hypothetical protein [Alloactinosynnema sp. L-07]|nr:hypothetical protein [Alloactinosynnema sp. L-07]
MVRIGRSTISEPGGWHIGVEAGPASFGGRSGVSFFRSVPDASAVPRLGV